MNFETSNNYLSSSSFHRGGAFPPPPSSFTKDATKSKAYLNAMRSLQEKIKELEKEKVAWLAEKQEIISTVENEYQEIMKQYRKEIDEYLTKEMEYKDKIRLLEEKTLENEGRCEEIEEKHQDIQTELEKKLQGVNREVNELKTRLQEELQRNDELTREIKTLKETHSLIIQENEKYLRDFREERGMLEERLTDIEGKYQSNLLEIQEVKTHYSHEINEYQEELLRIQGKYQSELEVLLQEKDQILLENRRLFNELSIKDEDLNMIQRKLENLTLEKKKDEMYKQIMTEFQISRDSSTAFLRNPNDIARNTFPANISEIQQNNGSSKNKYKESYEKTSSELEGSAKEEKISIRSRKDREKAKKKQKQPKNHENSSDDSSEIEELSYFKKEKSLQIQQNMQDFQKNFKEILSLESEIKQTNQKYESLMLESQVLKNNRFFIECNFIYN